jgi:hypothetical protein
MLVDITFLYARHRITVDLPYVLAHIASAANYLVDPLDGAVVESPRTILNMTSRYQARQVVCQG